MNYLNEILKMHPQDPKVHYQIAWTHDALGKETDAAPAYEKSISFGLNGDDLEEAYLGLGSTYRCLGQYKDSESVLLKAISLFPNNHALKVFYALTLNNLGNHPLSMEVLLKTLTLTTIDEKIKLYSRAINFYSDKLDEKFG